MIRHVIIEGPDGAGKDTLIEQLLKELPQLTKHERASTSVGGPVPDLQEWHMRDLAGIRDHVPSIYNRHPVISEPIYGRIVREQPFGWYGRPGWTRMQRELLAAHCMLVMCLPPLRVVEANVQSTQDGQMAGVVPHIRDIWRAYSNGPVWPGIQAWYDYTQLPSILPSLIDRVGRCLGRTYHGRV